ncbi:TonB-dependent receptor [Rubrivivax gelatinosus]|uniref:TonB-dependent receptor plug domain-containing protein n=1 Tax=Rubrivivax gelatinosus TaxID=28068 RepID=UPI001903A482|nr:TonB-dependent receptor [Rubrivivax gelatinosus]MBK1614452.1 TonB-dependent receptor [Rubrivivax gelatinosus]
MKPHTAPTWLALACAAVLAPPTRADDTVFDLGTITVTGARAQVGEMPQDQAGSVVTRSQMQQFGRDTVGDAVALLPGVTLSNNLRNEQMVYVRGFDARQVPLFIDGVPVYVPYDGYVDFGRFGTGDIAAIQVAKGYSSVAYGANALGGAINLVTRKPVSAFEGDAQLGAGAGGERKAGVNVGTRQGIWYAQAGASYREADGMRLSSDFKPTTTEDGGLRENSDRRDSKLSLKLGLTPAGGDEYALSYTRQDGEKGQPPSTDPASARYWRWPYWDKESLYFVSSTALGGVEKLKLRLYHDAFDNEVDSYTDASYTTLLTSGRGSVSTGRSIYHDRTTGAAVELESRRWQAHLLRLVLQHKADRHRELDANGTLNARYEDTLRSFGAEDLVELAPQWQLSVGAAHHELRPDEVYSTSSRYALPSSSGAANLQAGLFHDLTPLDRTYLTLARKTRLPTLKDRYSQRLGNYVENPDLGAETALNLEAGYQGRPLAALPGLDVEAAVFRSRIDDKIQSVFVAGGSSCSSSTPCQMRNVGEARVYGLELGARGSVLPWLDLGGNFTAMKQKNVSNPDTRLVGVPDRKLFAYAVVRTGAQLSWQATAEYDSRRWVSDTVALGGFSVFGLKASWKPMPALTLEAAVDNVGDKNYALDAGFPAAGRSWRTDLRYAF